MHRTSMQGKTQSASQLVPAHTQVVVSPTTTIGVIDAGVCAPCMERVCLSFEPRHSLHCVVLAHTPPRTGRQCKVTPPYHSYRPLCCSQVLPASSGHTDRHPAAVAVRYA
jgi:hypothetical protein